MSSIITLHQHFLIQTLTEKNKELQALNNLLFSKVASLKSKIKHLEVENKKEVSMTDMMTEFNDFEIIDFIE